VKKKKPYWPTWPRHFRPMTSVARTRQQIPIPDLANPFKRRIKAYVQMFGEREVRKPVMLVKKHDNMRVFFLPSVESAKRPYIADPAWDLKNMYKY